MLFRSSNPSTGLQKCIEIDDDRKLLPFFEKRMAAEVPADSLGDEFKGYVFQISGGNDKQGFPMKQGVLSATRARLLLTKGLSCYRPRRTGERKRKSVRGCIVGPDLSVLNLVVAKQGEADVPGLTDSQVPRRLGPKRATRMIRLMMENEKIQNKARRCREWSNSKCLLGATGDQLGMSTSQCVFLLYLKLFSSTSAFCLKAYSSELLPGTVTL